MCSWEHLRSIDELCLIFVLEKSDLNFLLSRLYHYPQSVSHQDISTLSDLNVVSVYVYSRIQSGCAIQNTHPVHVYHTQYLDFIITYGHCNNGPSAHASLWPDKNDFKSVFFIIMIIIIYDNVGCWKKYFHSNTDGSFMSTEIRVLFILTCHYSSQVYDWIVYNVFFIDNCSRQIYIFNSSVILQWQNTCYIFA